MTYLDLSVKNFTTLPECIEECHTLKCLWLNNCIQLEHIGGMPPNLGEFSAICCTSLTESSKEKYSTSLAELLLHSIDIIVKMRTLRKVSLDGIPNLEQGSLRRTLILRQ
ncbi:hypothetical protein K1719_045600 [Acacia pycnantha]|nr:hypothetical protein K1719_045600 [Acacia pycnantha]